MLAALLLALTSAVLTAAQQPGATHSRDAGCLGCHEGIEALHPEAGLGCVDCHGGNGAARTKEGGHVARPRAAQENERVAGLEESLAWRRFQNPMDLRVASLVCGECHPKLVRHLQLSLHGTTAGHLSDGFYEVGLVARRQSGYAVFPVRGSATPAEREPGAPEELVSLPAPRGDGSPLSLATHYPDLPRKECMQCHLWSRGRAVEGRVGFDGDYRGEGCAACHVGYALDGLSSSADRAAVRNEPGHPERHVLEGRPPTRTCTSCHYGDASIGLNFRGLSQLPPGAPGGPEIPGTTRQLLNRQFYLADAGIDPPDVHHERGLNCIDCHTANDVMGDGQLHGAMERAVEIGCSDCHGTFSARATLRTVRGTELAHLRRVDGRVLLSGKTDGAEHEVVELLDVLDPKSPRFNSRAARAMTPEHASLECWACHSSWNPNFLGFHCDRNASLTQLDLVSGERSPGRVTTQEKVFATWKSFYLGLDERGRVAPWLTGFSSMGSFTDERGERLLDQALPRTAAGLSGMTMIHHQMHTVRRGARSCVECHRTSSTWGMGSSNFRLARQLAFVAVERGIEVVALDRQRLSASQPLDAIVLPDVTALALRCDPLQGAAQELYAAEGARGVHVFDVRDPLHPRRLAFVACVEPQALLLAGSFLYVADGAAGLRIYDVHDPARPTLAARVPSCEARALALSWPWLYLADGAGGLLILDARTPSEPRVLATLSTAAEGREPRLVGVQELFQYSRPRARRTREGLELPGDLRSDARHLCALVDERSGLVLVDVTEPARPVQLFPDARARRREETRVEEGLEYRGLVLQSQVDLAEAQGGKRSAERDYAYVLAERRVRNASESFLSVWDVGDALRPRRVANPRVADTSEALALGNVYNPPFLQRVFFVAGAQGVLATDASLSTQPGSLGALGGLRRAYAVALEDFPLDKMLDEDGRPLKDVSHAGSRWLRRPEIERLLSVGASALGLGSAATSPQPAESATARLEFQRLDRDGSCFLEGDELAGHASVGDEDGDGRVSLLEFVHAAAGRSAPRGETYVDPAGPSAAARRVERDGDLARLFDGLDPQRFDADQDGALDRPECERALFAALDLDASGALGVDELSRHPGELRELRFAGGRAAQLFAALDLDKDGRIDAHELRLRDAEWKALDANGDGRVELAWVRDSKAARRSSTPLKPEWPARQIFRWPLPPTVTRERFASAFPAGPEKRLTRRELRTRSDLLGEFDENGDGEVGEREWQTRVDLIALYGSELTVDGFEERWDLDRDGKVTPAELPLPVYLQIRLGLRKP